MTAEEYFSSWEHMHGTLYPIIEEFSADTTLMVFLLNPVNPAYRLPEHVINILREKGYTRLYVFYLFSYIGELCDVSKPSMDKLISPKLNEYLSIMVPVAEKFFLAYGEVGDQELKKLLQQRISEVKQLITDIKGEVSFYTYGELSETGHPKRLEEITLEDEEIPYIL